MKKMKKTSFLFLMVVVMMVVSCGNSLKVQTVSLNDAIDSLNYALGFANGVELSQTPFLQGSDKDKVAATFIKTVRNAYNEAKARPDDVKINDLALNIVSAVKQQEKNGLAGIQAWTFAEAPFFQGMVNSIYNFSDESFWSNEDASSHWTIQSTIIGIASDMQDSIAATKFIKGKCPEKAQKITLANATDSISYAWGVNNGAQIRDILLAEDSTLANAKTLIKKVNTLCSKKYVCEELELWGQNLGTIFYKEGERGLLGQKELEPRIDLLLAGYTNGLLGDTTMLFDGDLQKSIQYVQETAMLFAFKDWKIENENFLQENAKKEGVTTTESGLQYEIIKAGKGDSPKPEETVHVRYKGTLIDSTLFDDGGGQVIKFGVTQVIPGWVEGLQLMQKGAKYKFYIPQNLAYGAQQQGPVIKPYSTLIFEVELVDISPAEKQ